MKAVLPAHVDIRNNHCLTWQTIPGHCCASEACFRGLMALRDGVKAIAAFLQQCMDPGQQSLGKKIPSKLSWK